MKAVSDRVGKVNSLTQVVDPVVPWRKAFRVVKQPFEGDFAIVEAPDAFAEHFRCESRSKEKQLRVLSDENPRYGTYYGAVFRLTLWRHSRQRAGVVVDETGRRLASDRVGGPVVLKMGTSPFSLISAALRACGRHCPAARVAALHRRT